MLLSDGTLIKNDVIEAFNAATTNPENIRTSGDINWDFVTGDVFMDADFYTADYINECIEVLIDNFYS